MDILSLLGSAPVIITIGTIALSIFVKTIIGIFRLGATFKTELVTKKEQREFENEMREDIKGYKLELQKSVMDACLKIVERELKPLENIKETEKRMDQIKTALDIQIKDILSKYDDVKEVADSVHSLALKVTRLEYGQETGENRRNEKK